MMIHSRYRFGWPDGCFDALQMQRFAKDQNPLAGILTKQPWPILQRICGMNDSIANADLEDRIETFDPTICNLISEMEESCSKTT